ncbi:MAG TPA: NmrA family NAD(P)-binding protein, partial [Steroidobacteraceae bacterium]
MSNQKIIAVAGATGAQGGGLVRAILADPSGGFAVRALTRDPASPAAQALAAAGAEVVAADLADPASVVRAFEGAYGAYCVTFFWNHMSPDKEREEARALANAARQARLKHVVWSTLEDTRRWMDIDDRRMPTLM